MCLGVFKVLITAPGNHSEELSWHWITLRQEKEITFSRIISAIKSTGYLMKREYLSQQLKTGKREQVSLIDYKVSRLLHYRLRKLLELRHIRHLVNKRRARILRSKMIILAHIFRSNTTPIDLLRPLARISNKIKINRTQWRKVSRE